MHVLSESPASDSVLFPASKELILFSVAGRGDGVILDHLMSLLEEERDSSWRRGSLLEGVVG